MRSLGQPSPYTHPHLLKPGEVTPGLTQVEYAQRRHKLMDLIKAESQGRGATEHAAILLSNPTYFMTNDIPYPFHQDTNFLYLCGFQEPDSILVLQSTPGEELPSHRSVLFVPRRDQSRELWDGPRSGADGAVALTGVDAAYITEEFGHFVHKLKDEGVTVWYDSEASHAQLHWQYMKPLLDIRTKSSQNRVRPLQKLVHKLRVIKSPAEVRLMQAAGRITSQAFIETMFASKAPIDEAVLYAKFDFECRSHGADILAYPPVVAGGNRSNTLHYVKNNQWVRDGEMVLLDGGCEYYGYVSDVTRTWPINGRFTGPQVEMYQAVLDVQKACLSFCSPGISLDNLYSLMLALLGEKLKDLGFLRGTSKEHDMYKMAQKYCPHHVGHYLGMDVHDTSGVSRSLPLEPGMALTVEPGLYVPEDDLGAPEKFRGLGVRIEDDLVITEDSSLILSFDCPKEIDEIEQIFSRSR
ncbi:xaa-Pro aminopeptidase 3 isoform X2 [Latimeria chalumnae]|uniref:Xaa-Pro aminopeptidase 3 n=2 Tax=Latimeria chalumnae TaxID=7897 RepID=H3A5P1_LATCH|nr:PREDICTED: probable Xaa-Pro aminopeptidase 3 isoform X2 [Latimeria chalumnae]|eukprot:XP_006011020.1 PREDICTED: probable Xaa-Pro aminopeptidase 3 isoform X2 [Latimeria chalumnae]